MENLNDKKNQLSNSLDNIPRCPECNLIASLKLNYNEGKPIVNYFCENNHNGDISLDEYMNKYNNYSLLKQKCEECNKNQNEIKDGLFYCSKCKKFICNSCIVEHQNEHNIIYYKRYDSLCKIHSNYFYSYCIECKKNICIYCYPQHESHELINLSKFNYNEESKNKLLEQINNLDLDIIKEKIISEIDKFKKPIELEIKYYKLLVNSYKYEENQNNLNYNIIQNIKNFEEIFGLNKIKIYENIFKEGLKFISFLQKTNEQNNLLKNNFKTLNNHSDYIYHLSQLKDGRLISGSADCTLNIYKKDTFELQLSIKEHSNELCCFTQLKNDNIITCSCDNTMNIIKLIDEDKYNLEQKLTGHNDYVNNVIEIR